MIDQQDSEPLENPIIPPPNTDTVPLTEGIIPPPPPPSQENSE